MTWTWLSDTFTDSPHVAALSDAAFRLHICALVWCNRYGTDGAVPRHMVVRLTDAPDPEALVKELLAAQPADQELPPLWTETADGWQLDWDGQQEAAAVKKRREEWKVRDQRRRKHNKGDHSMCDPVRCWALRDGNSRVSHGEAHGASTRESRPSHSRSPSHSPTPREGNEEGKARSAPSARAPGATRAPRTKTAATTWEPTEQFFPLRSLAADEEEG